MVHNLSQKRNLNGTTQLSNEAAFGNAHLLWSLARVCLFYVNPTFPRIERKWNYFIQIISRIKDNYIFDLVLLVPFKLSRLISMQTKIGTYSFWTDDKIQWSHLQLNNTSLCMTCMRSSSDTKQWMNICLLQFFFYFVLKFTNCSSSKLE